VDTFFNWATISSLYGTGISITIDEDMFYGGFGEHNIQNRWLHLTARNLDTGTITHRRAFINSVQPEFSDVDAYLDNNNNFHTMGCVENAGSIGFQYAMNPSSDFFPSSNNTVTATLKLEGSVPDLRVSRCKFYSASEPSATLVALSDLQVDLYDFILPSGTQMPTFSLNSSLDLADVQDILVFSKAAELSILYTTSNEIALYSDGVETRIKDNVLASSIHAKQLTEETYLIGFVLNSGEAGIIHYDSLTDTATEFLFSSSFTPTEVLPWQVPDTGELIAIVIGDQNLAYGYAEYVLP